MLFTLGVLDTVKFETLSSNSRLLNFNSMPEKVLCEKEKKKEKEKINVRPLMLMRFLVNQESKREKSLMEHFLISNK